MDGQEDSERRSVGGVEQRLVIVGLSTELISPSRGDGKTSEMREASFGFCLMIQTVDAFELCALNKVVEAARALTPANRGQEKLVQFPLKGHAHYARGLLHPRSGWLTATWISSRVNVERMRGLLSENTSGPRRGLQTRGGGAPTVQPSPIDHRKEYASRPSP
jgi:hypothetical protein